MNRRRIITLEQKVSQGKYAGVVTVNNYKEGDPLPDNIGPDTLIINLIDDNIKGDEGGVLV